MHRQFGHALHSPYWCPPRVQIIRRHSGVKSHLLLPLTHSFAHSITAEPHPRQNTTSTKGATERIPNMSSFGNHNTGSWNVTNSYNNITLNKIDEDREIARWLSPLRPQARHHSVQASRVEGVGCWVLEKNEFRAWSGGQGAPEEAVLFCHGDLGVGKTHIRSMRNPPRTTGYY